MKKYLKSKKIMAGLAIGAMSLSIWAPASQAAPVNNRYETIHLKANPNEDWNVYEDATYDNAGIRLYELAGVPDNIQFAFFQLDGGSYAIVNKNSGKPVTVGSGWIGPGVYRNNILIQRSWTGSAMERWNLREQGKNIYEIVNQGNGQVASFGGNGVSGPASLHFVDLDDSNPSDPDRVFYISRPIMGDDTISMPTLPDTGTRPETPKYTEGGAIDEQLPQTSNSVVVGASLIPCIMVKDNQYSDYTKIHQSPYYTLVKEEYWEKTFSTVLPADVIRTYILKTGMTKIDQEKMTDTLSISVGADLGFKFKDLTAAIKGSITKTLQTEISTTKTDMEEDTDSIILRPNKPTGYTGYQLVSKYTLKRTDGSIVSDPWIVKNPESSIVREQPSKPLINKG
ncbi:41.9 kDa insecticidal toxin [Bacillus mycoides KBAB4]|nr:41.9 kDa insecticidal toxin [Bacillus mycoides KBAB4]